MCTPTAPEVVGVCVLTGIYWIQCWGEIFSMKAINQCIDAVILITLRCEMVVSEALTKSEKFYKMCM